MNTMMKNEKKMKRCIQGAAKIYRDEIDVSQKRRDNCCQYSVIMSSFVNVEKSRTHRSQLQYSVASLL